MILFTARTRLCLGLASLLLAACAPAAVPQPPAASLPTVVATPSPTAASASRPDANVQHVRAVQAAGGSWTFYVTVSHPDTGWDDYADGWDVLLPDGTVLRSDPDSPFTRLLLHPHETEQPFKRSQSGLQVPPGVATLRVRAHDLVDGFGGHEVVLDWASVQTGTAVTRDQFEIVPLAKEE